ncbi:LytTR family transcriptional regulator [Lachnospiraceae bacterium KM106-2]|nr:LytTR family transcriptional regulator [Lachnospiraceae bacterium KM106-2]
MKVKLLINSKYKEPEIVICNHEVNEEVKKIQEAVLQAVNETMVAFTDSGAEVIPYATILRFYSENQRVYAQTVEKSYVIHMRLYEIEAKLGEQFVRISNSEIVNIKMIERLDTSVTGTIQMFLKTGIVTYVSRRNVKRIKKAFGL